MNFIKKLLEVIMSLFKDAKNSPAPKITREDVIKNNPEIFAGTDWKKFTHIVMHHSLTKDQQVVDWDAITRYHTKTKGWRFNGYNSGVEIVNGKLEVMIGRPLNIDGAHTYGMNDKAIGICVIGAYDYAPPHKEKLKVLVVLVKKYMKVFNIPKENVIGHREVPNTTKTCPGTKFDMDKFRSLL